MTELEKLVQTWEKFKPTDTPHEHIWNGFIEDAKAAIEREKQALSLGGVVSRSEQFTCSCGIPPAIRLCEGVESCLKCGESLSK